MALLYLMSIRPLLLPGDELLVERTRTDAGATFGDREAHRRATFPMVMRLADRTCVELRSRAKDGRGTYLACYNARSGKKVEERAESGF